MTNDTIECSWCGKLFKPNSTRQKFCSESCKQKNKRNTNLEEVHLEPVVQPSKVSEKILQPHVRGHWFGRPPHRAIWTDCLRKDCPYEHTPEPDWEVTCTEPCCGV